MFCFWGYPVDLCLVLSLLYPAIYEGVRWGVWCRRYSQKRYDNVILQYIVAIFTILTTHNA